MDTVVNTPIANRSKPSGVVIPVLGYEHVDEAARWLCDVFGFTVRLRIGSHRVQLRVNNGLGGEGSVVATERGEHAPAEGSHSVLVQVADAQSHYEHVLACGAEIVNTPTDHFFGERQYTVVDLGGHRWTFSQSIADIDPESWGGVVPKREL
jgi:uncharacterized glyoxalase superfamily protein PhnB